MTEIYVDLEGNKLSCNSTLSLVTILLEPEREVQLVDVTTIGWDAFNTAGVDSRTLKSLLESRNVFENFFDIRNDSDALSDLYEIRVAGIEDLQLMELASRSFSKKHVNGLPSMSRETVQLQYNSNREKANVAIGERQRQALI